MSPCYQGGEEGPWPKLGLPGLVWKSKLAWHFVIWHLRATETSIYSASDVVSISAVGTKRKRACIRLKVFLDSNLEATAGQFGVVNLKSTRLLGRSDNLTSQHLLSHPPMHRTAVSGHSASPPIRHFVSSFHALAHDVGVIWTLHPIYSENS